MKTFITSTRGPKGDTVLAVQYKGDKQDLRLIQVKESELDASGKNALSNFISLLNGKAYVSIEDMPYTLDIDHLTSEPMAQEVLDLNYEKMSTEDKDKVHNFVNLIKTL